MLDTALAWQRWHFFTCMLLFPQAIPKHFSRKYKKNLDGSVLLQQQSPGSRAWALRVLRKSGSYHLTRGWSRFVIENKITLGDILIFRLIKRNCFSFEIDGLEKIPSSVDDAEFSNSKQMNKSYDEGIDSDSDEPPALPNHRKDSPMNMPMTFQALVKQSIHWLYIGASYRNCLPKNNEVIILMDSNRKKWPVNWLAGPRRMAGGWTAFVHRHKVNIGDSLQFERQSKRSFKVTKIVRAAESEAGSKSFTSQDIQLQRNQSLKLQRNRALPIVLFIMLVCSLSGVLQLIHGLCFRGFRMLLFVQQNIVT